MKIRLVVCIISNVFSTYEVSLFLYYIHYKFTQSRSNIGWLGMPLILLELFYASLLKEV